MPIRTHRGRVLMDALRLNKKEFFFEDIKAVHPTRNLRPLLQGLELNGFISVKLVKRGKGNGSGRPYALFYFKKANIDKIKRVFNVALVEEGIIMPDE